MLGRREFIRLVGLGAAAVLVRPTGLAADEIEYLPEVICTGERRRRLYGTKLTGCAAVSAHEDLLAPHVIRQ